MLKENQEATEMVSPPNIPKKIYALTNELKVKIELLDIEYGSKLKEVETSTSEDISGERLKVIGARHAALNGVIKIAGKEMKEVCPKYFEQLEEYLLWYSDLLGHSNFVKINAKEFVKPNTRKWKVDLTTPIEGLQSGHAGVYPRVGQVENKKTGEVKELYFCPNKNKTFVWNSESIQTPFAHLTAKCVSCSGTSEFLKSMFNVKESTVNISYMVIYSLLGYKVHAFTQNVLSAFQLRQAKAKAFQLTEHYQNQAKKTGLKPLDVPIPFSYRSDNNGLVSRRELFFDIDQGISWEVLQQRINMLGISKYIRSIVQTSPYKYHIHILVDSPPPSESYLKLNGYLQLDKRLAKGTSSSSCLNTKINEYKKYEENFVLIWTTINRILCGDINVKDSVRVAAIPGFINPKNGFIAKTVLANKASFEFPISDLNSSLSLTFPFVESTTSSIYSYLEYLLSIPKDYLCKMSASNNINTPFNFDAFYAGCEPLFQRLKGIRWEGDGFSICPERYKAEVEAPHSYLEFYRPDEANHDRFKCLFYELYQKETEEKREALRLENKLKSKTKRLEAEEIIAENNRKIANLELLQPSKFDLSSLNLEKVANFLSQKGIPLLECIDLTGKRNEEFLKICRYAHRFINIEDPEHRLFYFKEVVLKYFENKKSNDLNTKNEKHMRRNFEKLLNKTSRTLSKRRKTTITEKVTILSSNVLDNRKFYQDTPEEFRAQVQSIFKHFPDEFRDNLIKLYTRYLLNKRTGCITLRNIAGHSYLYYINMLKHFGLISRIHGRTGYTIPVGASSGKVKENTVFATSHEFTYDFVMGELVKYGIIYDTYSNMSQYTYDITPYTTEQYNLIAKYVKKLQSFLFDQQISIVGEGGYLLIGNRPMNVTDMIHASIYDSGMSPKAHNLVQELVRPHANTIKKAEVLKLPKVPYMALVDEVIEQAYNQQQQQIQQYQRSLKVQAVAAYQVQGITSLAALMLHSEKKEFQQLENKQVWCGVACQFINVPCPTLSSILEYNHFATAGPPN